MLAVQEVGVKGGAGLAGPWGEGVLLDEAQDVALDPQGPLVVLLADPALLLLLLLLLLPLLLLWGGLQLLLLLLLRGWALPPAGLPLPGLLGRRLLGDALQWGVGSGEGAGQGGARRRWVLDVVHAQRQRVS